MEKHYENTMRAFSLHSFNRIVIVVMRADENDYDGIQTFRKRAAELPAWPPAATANAPR
jgi:hypothetical protein